MTQKVPIMLIITIYSAANHLSITISLPIKAINKLHVLLPHKKGSQNRQYSNIRYCRFILYTYPLSQQVTHAPLAMLSML